MKARDIFDGAMIVTVLALIVGLYSVAGTSDYRAALETERRIAEVNAHRDLRHPCDGATIVQWGRYHEAKSEPACAKGTSDPRNAFSVPCNLDAKTGRCR